MPCRGVKHGKSLRNLSPTLGFALSPSRRVSKHYGLRSRNVTIRATCYGLTITWLHSRKPPTPSLSRSIGPFPNGMAQCGPLVSDDCRKRTENAERKLARLRLRHV